MRVINISHEDYANFSYDNCLAMRSVGLDADAFILKKHPFGYARQAKLVRIEQIVAECHKADLIQVMHTCGTMWDIVKTMDKPIIVWHTGTRYRQNSEKHNERWNSLVLKSVCVLPEFPKLGCAKSHYISMTVDTEALQPDYTTPDILRIAHFPSNAQVKGTEKVNKFINDIWKLQKTRFRWTLDVNKVNAQQQLERLQNCDVYIEMFAPEQDGYEYGSFGTTALEAAALGKIVVTNNINAAVYNEYYGECKLIIANTEDQFKFVINGLLSWNKNQIVKRKQQTRTWVENNHSRNATGTRILEMLKSIPRVQAMLS